MTSQSFSVTWFETEGIDTCFKYHGPRKHFTTARVHNTSDSESPYTLFQNGRHFSILLFTCKLALVASFEGKYSFEF